jgi:hypothetical protein
MNLFLDLISPTPEFTVFDENKIIITKQIIKSEGNKLSEDIIPVFLDIEKSLNLGKYLKSLIVTTGPASYTALRVGIAFMLGQHFTRNVKIASLSAEDFLKFDIASNNDSKHGMYIISANNQRFICYKLENSKYEYIKLDKQNINSIKDLKNIDVLYYNYQPLKNFELKFKQKKYIINENVFKIYSNLNFLNSEIIKPIYISNNQKLN